MPDNINEMNYKQTIFDYAVEKYKDRMKQFMDKFRDEFPYYDDEFDDDFQIKNYLDWLILEKTLPHSGKTIAEEYVEDHPDIDEGMKQKLLQMKYVISSEFSIISKNGLEMNVKDNSTNKIYNILLQTDNPNLNSKSIIIGRIHQFGEHFVLTGIFRIRVPLPFMMDPHIMMDMFEEGRIRDFENIVLSPNTKLTAVYNKYPSNWVDGTCKALSISTKDLKGNKAKQIALKLTTAMPEVLAKLPQESKDVLNPNSVEYT